MNSIVCEQCRISVLKRSKNARFCSPKCAFYYRRATGCQLTHSVKHTAEAREKIRAARSRQGSNVWNKGKKTGEPSWNSGLTKFTDERMAAIARNAAGRPHKKSGPMSAETKKKLSVGRMGDANWAKRPEVREKIRQSVLALYRARPEILENRRPAGVNQHSGTMSSLERPVADALRSAGVGFVHNRKIGRFWADFVILDRVVVECDGEYWHRDVAKERRRDSALMDLGYFVFHLKERDILNNPSECVNRVLNIYMPFSDTYVLSAAGAAL